MTKDVIAKLQNLTLLYAEDEEGRVKIMGTGIKI